MARRRAFSNELRDAIFKLITETNQIGNPLDLTINLVSRMLDLHHSTVGRNLHKANMNFMPADSRMLSRNPVLRSDATHILCDFNELCMKLGYPGDPSLVRPQRERSAMDFPLAQEQRVDAPLGESRILHSSMNQRNERTGDIKSNIIGDEEDSPSAALKRRLYVLMLKETDSANFHMRGVELIGMSHHEFDEICSKMAVIRAGLEEVRLLLSQRI